MPNPIGLNSDNLEIQTILMAADIPGQAFKMAPKSEFILLIFDGVWGLFIIQTFLKNLDPPLSFQNSQIEIENTKRVSLFFLFWVDSEGFFFISDIFEKFRPPSLFKIPNSK